MAKKYGYINKEGKIVINLQFTDAGNFSEGLAKVSLEEGAEKRFGFINKEGKIVINPQFYVLLGFKGGLAEVAEDSFKIYGYIDKTGKYVWKDSEE